MASTKELTVAQLSGLKKWVDRQKTGLSKLLNKAGLDASAVDRVKGIVDTLNQLAKKADEYGKKITPKNNAITPPSTIEPELVEPSDPGEIVLNAGQKEAFAKIMDFFTKNTTDQVFTLIGAAGTGKTTLVNSIVKALRDSGSVYGEVILSAPTHRANAVTRSKNPSESLLTLHQLLGLKPEVNLEEFDAKDVKFASGEIDAFPSAGTIIIDESSMINSQLYEAILEKLNGTPVKVLFLGDAAQLQPVDKNAKNVKDSPALTEPKHKAELTKVERAKNPELLGESVAVRESGKFTNQQNHNDNNGIQFFNSQDSFLNKAVEAFKSKAFKKNPLLARIVAATNARVLNWNRAVRLALYGKDAPAFVEGELLMGYGRFTKLKGKSDNLTGEKNTGLSTIANGVDYIVTKVGKETTDYWAGVGIKVIPITIRDVFGINPEETVMVVSPNNSPETMRALSDSFMRLDRQAFLQRSRGEFDEEAGKFVLMNDLTGEVVTPNKSWNKTLINKTIAYGYAHTIHKSQGGTYNFVFVDDPSIGKFPSENDRKRLRYVGVTRAERGAFILTDGAIAAMPQRPDSIERPKGRDLGALPMHYKMPPHGVRQDLRAQYPNGTTTAQLMADGHRTATTRRAFGAVGDTFTVDGREYRITALEQVDMDSAAGREKWAQREGWDVDYIQQHGSGQVRTGAVQTVFERVKLLEDKKTAPVKSELEQRIDRYTDELKNHANTSTEKLTEVAAWAAKKLAEIAEARKAKNLSADRIVQLVGHVSKLESFAKSVNDVLVKRNKGGIAPAAAPAVTPTPPKPAPAIVNPKFPTPTFTARIDDDTPWTAEALLVLPYAQISRLRDSVNIALTTPVATEKVVIDKVHIEKNKTTFVGKTSKGDAIKLRVDDAYMEIYVVPTLKLFRIERALGSTGSPAEVQLRKALGDAVVDAYLDNTIDDIQLRIAELLLQRDFTEEVKHVSDAYKTNYYGTPPSKPDSSTAPTPPKPASPTPPATPPTPTPATPSAEKKTGLASIFPKLVGGVSNFFLTAFKLRSTQSTRLAGLEDPLGSLEKALSSEAELTAFLGSRAKRTLDGDTSKAYAETIFAAMPSLANAMNARLKPLLAKLNGKKDQPDRKSNLQRLLAGDMDVTRMVNSRVLSLVEPDGKGGFQYNSALLGSALLAGAQWMLTANASNPMMTAKRAGALIGIKEGQVGYDLINALSEGIDKQTALAAIAAKITEYWGITPNADVGIGHTRGIPMAMAIEVLASLVATKSIETSIVRVTKSGRVLKDNEAAPINGFSTDGKNTPIPEVVLELTRFIVPALPKEDPLSRYPDLIDKTVLIDPTPTFFFGDSVPKISNKQKRNRYVPVNPHAQRAMQNFSNVPYFRNLYMEGFFLDGLGLNGMLAVLGNGELSEKVWNKGHFEKVDGQNKAIAFAHDYLINMLEEHSDAAEAVGVDTADYLIRFGFGSTKVMRFQQEGALTPQGNKTMREMVSPNRAEVNLTDPAALEVFRLSQAQALGISVHNMTRESMMEKLNTLLLTEEVRAGVAVFTKWLETGTELNADDFTDLRKAMGGSPSNVALHAMMEQAMYQAALESGPDALKNFTTHMYVEADGATNGPINSIALLTTGHFTEAYVRNMAMGGLFLGEKGMSLNAYRSVKSMDLYKTAAAKASRLIAELQQEHAGTEVGDQANHVSTLMGLLFGKDWAFNDKDELVIGRNILKNPLTVTVYGAGAAGIANKITSNMLDAIYERFSAALQSGGSIAENMFPGPNAAADFARFNKAMANVISNVVESDKGDLYLESSNASYFPTNMNKKELQNFVFNKGQISAIQGNLLYLLVGPIREAIDETMGESVAASVVLLRKGTQVQSLLLAHEFDRLVTARLEEKAKDPSWKITDYLSQQELDDIHAQLAPLQPLITTSTQSYYTAGKQSAFNNGRLLATGTDNTLSADLFIEGPANSGVSGIASLVQGFGDAKMMQNIGQKEAGSKKSLPVFDGLNLALDNVTEGSRLANEGVYSSWQGNPLLAVSQMFDALMSQVHAGMLNDPATFNAVLEALVTGKKMRASMNAEDLYAVMQQLQLDLQMAADSVTARHLTSAQVVASIDQMAAVGAPYQAPGKTKLIGTDADKAAQMSAIYIEHLKTVIAARIPVKQSKGLPKSPPANAPGTQERAPVEPDEVVEEEAVIEPDDNLVPARPEGEVWSVDVSADFAALGEAVNGARVLEMSDVTQLLEKAKKTSATAGERTIINDLIKSLADSGWRVVVGDTAAVSSWFQETHGKGVYEPTAEELATGVLAGFADAGTKTIAVMTGSLETTVHELIHAAVQEMVDGYYNGTLSAEKRAAVEPVIKNLEKLMDRFMGTDAKAMPSETQATVAYVQNLVQGLLKQGKKSDALNEFIAWGLANRQTAQALKNTSFVDRISEMVYKAIKKLIWGKNTAPVMPGADMFSNLMFNTRALIAEQAKGEHFASTNGVLNMIYASNPVFGNSERLTRVREGFVRVIMNYVDTIPVPGNVTLPKDVAVIRKAELAALTADVDLTTAFAAEQLLNTPQERDTFSMIISALGTEARIDGNALTRANDLFQHFLKTVEVEDLMDDPNSTHPADRYLAQQQLNLLTGAGLVKTDSAGRSSLLPAFVALATVNDKFRSVLEEMGMPKDTPKSWGTADGALESLGNAAMESLRARLSGEGKGTNMRAQLDALMEHIVEQTVRQQNDFETFYQKAGGYTDIANDKVVGWLSQGSDKLKDASDKLRAASNSRLAQTVANVGSVVAGIASEKNAKIMAQGLQEAANRTNLWGPLQRLITEMIGRTESNAKVFDLIKQVRAYVHNVRQGFVESVPTVVAKEFSRKLKNSEWVTLQRGLAKTDLASLLAGGMTMDQVQELVTDKAALAKAIALTKNAVTAAAGTAARSTTMLDKTAQLAEFMVNGNPGIALLRNAEAIANMLDGTTVITSAADPALVAAVDKLASLLALELAIKNDPIELPFLVQEEKAGTAFALSYLVGQRTEEVRKIKASPAAALNYYKGHITSNQGAGLSLVIADDADHASMLGQSYKRVGDYVGSNLDASAGSRGYYFSTVGQQAFFNQGVLQNVRETASGVDALTGFSMNATAGRITDRKQVNEITRRLKSEVSNEENLMPIFDSRGSIVAYERSIKKSEMGRLNFDDHLAKNLGIWRGRQAEEQAGKVYNTALVEALHAMLMTDRAAGKEAGQYIDLFDKKVLAENPVVADAMKLMTPAVRAEIRELFGKEFLVRKDMVIDAIGERNATVGDAWTGNSAWSKETQKKVKNLAMSVFGNEAFRYLRNTEKTVQNFVTDARVLIVIKSAVVPALNLMSNIYQMASIGIPLRDIIVGMPKKTVEVDAYVKSKLRAIEIEAKMRATTNDVRATRKLELELKTINDNHRRMSIWPLIEAGEFSTISDIGISRDEILLSEGRLHAYMEKMVNKLPGATKTVGRYALITKDTALFQGLQKAVDYGDFLAKAIVYDHLTKKKGKTEAEALGRITEEFVHYDRLPGRFRGYLESVGIVWFWNFKIRSTKVALSMIRNNPVHALLAGLTPAPSGVGTPISDNFFSKLLEGTLGHSIGPDQGLRALMLNPWANLIR